MWKSILQTFGELGNYFILGVGVAIVATMAGYLIVGMWLRWLLGYGEFLPGHDPGQPLLFLGRWCMISMNRLINMCNIVRTTSISDLWCSFSFSKTDIEHWRDSNNAKLLHFRCSHGRFGFRDYYTSYRLKSESSRADSLDSIIACNVSETREAHLNLITLKLDTVYIIFNTCTCRLCHLVALAILAWSLSQERKRIVPF